MAELIITESNFNDEVLRSEKTVLLDFWAEWCGPCRMLAPVIAEVANEHPEIKVGKINVDEQAALASRFGIVSIPTVVVMKNGVITETAIGYKPKAELEALIK